MQSIKVGAGAFEALDEDIYEYSIPNAKTGDPLGTIRLRGFNQRTLDRYREIRNGDGRRKGDEAKAREYIFRKTFFGFEFVGEGKEIDLDEGEKEVDFFLKKCPKIVDAAIIRHLAAVFPDIDEKK